jgi:hypothetical protein
MRWAREWKRIRKAKQPEELRIRVATIPRIITGSIV